MRRFMRGNSQIRRLLHIANIVLSVIIFTAFFAFLTWIVVMMLVFGMPLYGG